MKRLGSIVVVMGALTALARAGNVLVVAPTGAPYTNIQSAINASADGDVILVKSNGYPPYPGFVIGDQSLTIAEDAGAIVSVFGNVTIGPTASSRTIVISGIDFYAPFVAPAPADLTASSVSGFLRLQDCSCNGAHGSNAPTSPNGGSAARFSNCAHVVVANCSFKGGASPQGNATAGPQPGTGGVGLEVVTSDVALYDSTVTGGNGDDATLDPDGGHGGLGLDSVNSSVFAANSGLMGGRGGAPDCFGHAGNGGDALHQTGSSTVTALECVLAGGSPGALYPCHWTPGNPGAGGGATSILTVPGGARTMSCTSVVREQGTVTVTVTGSPGDQVGLYLSFLPAQQLVPAWNGVLAVSTAAGSGSRLVRIGTIGASGTLVRTFVQPDLGAGVQAQTRWLQTRIFTQQGQTVLGTPLALTAIDAVF